MKEIVFTEAQKETIFMLHKQGLTNRRIAEILKEQLDKKKKKK